MNWNAKFTNYYEFSLWIFILNSGMNILVDLKVGLDSKNKEKIYMYGI